MEKVKNQKVLVRRAHLSANLATLEKEVGDWEEARSDRQPAALVRA